MNCKKKAFTLLEVLIVLALSSVILIYTFSFAKELFYTNKENEKIASLKIDLNSTKIIIKKNLPHSKDKLTYDGSTLFFDGNIFLKNVTKYEQNITSDVLTIHIVLEDKIEQTWKFKL